MAGEACCISALARHSERPSRGGRRLIRAFVYRALSAAALLSAVVPGAAAGAAQRGEMLDRVLAVVDGQIITLSDVRAALHFQLVPPDVSTDPVHAALRRLIDRRLMLSEVERYAPPEPAATAIETGVAAIQARFPSRDAFDAALQQSAMTRDEMRRYVRDSLRLELYLQQRFAASAQPSEDDLVLYYKQHAGDFAKNGVLQRFDAVREQVRGLLMEERQAAAISDWIAGLRRRGSVIELPQVVR